MNETDATATKDISAEVERVQKAARAYDAARVVLRDARQQLKDAEEAAKRADDEFHDARGALLAAVIPASAPDLLGIW